MNDGSEALRGILACGLVMLLTASAGAQQSPQLEWADRLAANEELVHSMHVTYTVEKEPTDPALIDRIKQVYVDDPYNNIRGAIWTQEMIEKDRQRIDWFKKDRLERINILPPDGSDPSRYPESFIDSTVFDGVVVKTLSYRYKKPAGAIETPADAGWEHSDWHYPSNILFEHEKTPFSEIVRNSPDFKAETVVVNGENCTRLTVVHPKMADRTLVMTFAPNGDLIERTAWDWEDINGARVNLFLYRLVPSDYRTFPTGGGNEIRFPMKVREHWPVGDPFWGRERFEALTKLYEMQCVEFNVDIPDDVFTLRFPPDATVMDLLTGTGVVSMSDNVAEGVLDTLKEITEAQEVGATGSTLVSSGTPRDPSAVGEVTAGAPRERRYFPYVAAAVFVVIAACFLSLRSRTRRRESQ